MYPWGDNAPTDKLCNFGTNVNDTTPVRRYLDGKSPYGLLDIAGNAREWTSSLWGKDTSKSEFGYPYNANDGRENPNAPDAVRRVVRGGSFWDYARVMRCGFRDSEYPDFPDGGIGFRVVSPGL